MEGTGVVVVEVVADEDEEELLLLEPLDSWSWISIT